MGDDGPMIDNKKCMGCGICVVNCPNEVMTLRREEREHVHKDLFELGMRILKETDRSL
jgi:ferredoxin